MHSWSTVCSRSDLHVGCRALAPIDRLLQCRAMAEGRPSLCNLESLTAGRVLAGGDRRLEGSTAGECSLQASELAVRIRDALIRLRACWKGHQRPVDVRLDRGRGDDCTQQIPAYIAPIPHWHRLAHRVLVPALPGNVTICRLSARTSGRERLECSRLDVLHRDDHICVGCANETTEVDRRAGTSSKELTIPRANRATPKKQCCCDAGDLHQSRLFSVSSHSKSPCMLHEPCASTMLRIARHAAIIRSSRAECHRDRCMLAHDEVLRSPVTKVTESNDGVGVRTPVR